MITTKTPIKPGIYPNVPFEDYLTWPFWSQSSLKAGQKSMAHAKQMRDDGFSKPPTDFMLLGSALHTAFLEPELLIERVVLWDGARRAGKEWQAFKAENEGRIILTAGLHEKLVGMVRAMRKHGFVRKWSSAIEDVEVSAVGDVHGLQMKGRADAMTHEPLVDIKKVQSCNVRRITSTVLDFGYHIQAFIYQTLFNRDRFVLLCVEENPPYDVVPYEFSPALLRRGEREGVALIEQILECEQTGVWPGRSSEIVMLELPEWAESSDAADAISFDGLPTNTDEVVF